MTPGWPRSRTAAEEAGLPFGCIAVDGAHIYEPTEEARAENRARAYRWLDIAGYLGAKQVRIDAGGPEEMPDDVFAIIVDGYNDLIPYAAARGIEVIVENHWGPTKHADNCVKLLEAVDGLGLLFDSNNWAEGTARRGLGQVRQVRQPHPRQDLRVRRRGQRSHGRSPQMHGHPARRRLRRSLGHRKLPGRRRRAGRRALKTLALMQARVGRKVGIGDW